eukprot:649973-Hanusia_phi.AAC.4
MAEREAGEYGVLRGKEEGEEEERRSKRVRQQEEKEGIETSTQSTRHVGRKRAPSACSEISKQLSSPDIDSRLVRRLQMSRAVSG